MVTCSICKKEIEKSEFVDSMPVICSNECYHNYFWNEKVEKFNEDENGYRSEVAIANGTHYHICPDSSDYFRGCGGRQFKIKFNDGRIVQSKNLWCQREVPESHRHLLPNNAEFLVSDEDIRNIEINQNIINNIRKKMKKEEVKARKPQVGDNINVDIFQPKEGKFPIGRYEGIICKLRFGANVKFVPYGSTCYCQIVEIKEKCLIVLVEEVIKSPEANRYEAEQRIKELQKLQLSNKKDKVKKIKRNFPFLSKSELK